MLAVIAAAGLAFLVERLVVTDREAIASLPEEARGAVSRGDATDARDALDDSFADGDRDADAFVAWVMGLRRQHAPRGIDLEVLEIAISGDVAAARVRVTSDVAVPYGYRMAVEGRVQLVRRAEGWRITSARRE